MNRRGFLLGAVAVPAAAALAPVAIAAPSDPRLMGWDFGAGPDVTEYLAAQIDPATGKIVGWRRITGYEIPTLERNEFAKIAGNDDFAGLL